MRVKPVVGAALLLSLWVLWPGVAAQEQSDQQGFLIAARSEAQDSARVRHVLEAMENSLPYVPGELLVRFVPGAEPRQQASVLRVLRAEIKQENARWIGDVLHLTGLEIDDPEWAATVLQRQPEVLYAQPNYLRRLQSTPTDPQYSRQWNFQAINMPQAWDINPGGRADVLVAVVDSGLTTAAATYGFWIWNGSRFQLFSVPFAKAMDFDHSRVKTGREFVTEGWVNQAGQVILFDAVGRGTHVAGTMAQQTNNALAFAGIAHGVTLLPVKVCWDDWDVQLYWGYWGIRGFVSPTSGGCTDDASVRGLRYAADEGAKVINMSIGGLGAAPAIADALRYATSRGAFVALAAGNEALEGNPTTYPARYASDIDGVVAVGAVSRALTRARYSSYGSWVELVAPGGDGTAYGPSENQIWQMGPLQTDLSYWLQSPRFDRYQEYSSAGTSMASPHVAGLAALLYSQGITNPGAIEDALKRFARDLGPTGRDNEYGYGLIDARAALRGLGLNR